MIKVDPRYTHDCDTCKHLGQWTDLSKPVESREVYDLYHCMTGGPGETFLARFGDEGPQYASMSRAIFESALERGVEMKGGHFRALHTVYKMVLAQERTEKLPDRVKSEIKTLIDVLKEKVSEEAQLDYLSLVFTDLDDYPVMDRDPDVNYIVGLIVGVSEGLGIDTLDMLSALDIDLNVAKWDEPEEPSEPEECAGCGSTESLMNRMEVDVDGAKEMAWVCDACGHAHLDSENSDG